MAEAQVARLVTAQAAQRAVLTDRAIRAAEAAFGRFDGWYSERLVGEVAARVAAQVLSSSRAVAGVTDAYLARVATDLAAQAISPAGVAITSSLRTGVASDAAVYERVAGEYRYQRSLGVPDDGAKALALMRLRTMVATDLGLAHRAQSRKFMIARSVQGFRRVIRPELSKTGVCGLCIVASDRTYNRAQLMPIHDRCNCETLPIINGVDPGRSLNRADLTAVYDAVGGTEGARLKDLRVQVVEHGELGPRLVNSRHNHRTAADVARDRAA